MICNETVLIKNVMGTNYGENKDKDMLVGKKA